MPWCRGIGANRLHGPKTTKSPRPSRCQVWIQPHQRGLWANKCMREKPVVGLHTLEAKEEGPSSRSAPRFTTLPKFYEHEACIFSFHGGPRDVVPRRPIRGPKNSIRPPRLPAEVVRTSVSRDWSAMKSMRCCQQRQAECRYEQTRSPRIASTRGCSTAPTTAAGPAQA